MKLEGFIGGSGEGRSLTHDAQRTINFYIEMGANGNALVGTPGLLTFADVGNGPIRGEFASATGRAFVVSGYEFYEVFIDGTSSLIGNLNTSTGAVTFDENFTQLAVCDGASLYIMTLATDAFAEVTDADFPGAGTVCSQDQYFIVNKPDTGEFYLSALADGTSWAALDFATAESSSDDLVRVFAAFGQLWLFGERTTEVWYNSGDVNFPFARVEGAKMQVGCASPYSVVSADNSVLWIGQDENGKGIVYRANGYSPARISNGWVEYKLGQVEDLTQIRGFTYQEDGHLFYVITGGNLETSIAFDVSTGLWFERASLDDFGGYEQHRAASHMFAFGKHLVGDKESGVVYEQSLDYYDDDGAVLRSERIFSHLQDENNRFIVKELQVDFETGVGLTSGQGSAPIAMLQTSNDGGRTWGPEYQASMGAIGEYRTRAVWRRLGQYDIFTAKVVVTDPVKRVIMGAYLK